MDRASGIDRKLKETHLAIARLELRDKEDNFKNNTSIWKNAFSNPAVLGAIITAFVALNGAIITALISEQQTKLEDKKTQAQLTLDREKFESSLIIEAVKTGDPDQAAQNLRFLRDVGFLSDTNHQLEKYLANRVSGAGAALPGAMLAGREEFAAHVADLVAKAGAKAVLAPDTEARREKIADYIADLVTTNDKATLDKIVDALNAGFKLAIAKNPTIRTEGVNILEAVVRLVNGPTAAEKMSMLSDVLMPITKQTF